MKLVNMIIGLLLVVAGCTNIDQPVDKSELRPYDYRLFQSTEVWPLAKAAKMKDIKRVNELLDESPELANITDSVYGNTILMMAILHQDYRLFKALLSHGANVNYHNLLNGYSPLIEACHYKEYDRRYAKELVEYGANINDTSFHLPYAQISPLMAAAGCGNKALTQYLIKHGANVNYSNNFGTSVLGEALLSDEHDTSLLLLENGADYSGSVYNRLDEYGKRTIPTSILTSLRHSTPAWGTSSYRAKKKIIKFLKERGLDYDTVPIPDYIVQEAKERYPLIWEWYLRNY